MDFIDHLCASTREGGGPWSHERDFDLTPCFENVVVAMLPQLLFGVLSLFLIQPIRTTASLGLHSSVRMTTAKIALSLGIAGVYVGWFAAASSPDTRLLAATCVLSFSLCALVLFLCDSRFKVGCSAVLVFLLLHLAALAIQLRTSFNDTHSPLSTKAVLVAVFALALPLFVLENQPRPKLSTDNKYTPISQTDDEETEVQTMAEDDDAKLLPQESPEEYANIFSRLSFHWMDGLMKLGYKKDLEMEDLWALREQDSARLNSNLFLRNWGRETEKARPSLLNALMKSYGLAFGSAAIFKASQDALSFLQPTFLRYIMEFTNSWSPENRGHEQPVSRGFCIAILMLTAAICQTFLLHQYFHTCIVIGMRVKAAVITAIYQKALRLSPAARQSSTVGEIVNLMSVDAGRLGDLTTYFHIVWSGPFQICLALYFLYFTLGWAIFAGVAVMLLMIPVNGLLATWSRRLNKIQMGNKDKRTKLMDELLNGIKVIKLYAWEMPFLKRVNAVRELELSTLMRMGYLSAGSSFTWVCTPLMVSFVSFAVYSIISDEPLTSTKVFVSMSLFNLLQFPLAMFPSVITAIIDASVSFTRLYNFLMNEELDPDAVTYEPEPVFPDPAVPLVRVRITNGSFSWTKDSATPTIHGINLSAKHANLVAVVGMVGSGKSSLLSAVLGEMYKAEGNVTVCGRVAYVSQTPWIMNSTLRENIVFGGEFREDFYHRVVEACGLGPDLEVLPGGDMTEIGERGINLSGGQKQRINLAR
ncbi:hypothetical protein HDU98_010066, partial [Podochytrium sp. JEL0797]